MSILLGNMTFDDAHTTVEERLEEVGGRDERRIIVSGLITGLTTQAAIESAMDDVVQAASAEDYATELSVRPGRRLWVRRDGFSREVDRRAKVGAFKLSLGARDPFEESTDETTTVWPVTASGDMVVVTTPGNAPSPPRLTLVASGSVVNPSFSDGARTITYQGTVPDGDALIVDGVNGTVRLNGVDVTAYTAGEVPRVMPGGNSLVYMDDGDSSHTAAVTVAYRDRWW